MKKLSKVTAMLMAAVMSFSVAGAKEISIDANDEKTSCEIKSGIDIEECDQFISVLNSGNWTAIKVDCTGTASGKGLNACFFTEDEEYDLSTNAISGGILTITKETKFQKSWDGESYTLPESGFTRAGFWSWEGDWSATINSVSIEFETGVTRIAGDGRYETSMQAADALKEVKGVDAFENIVVATGKAFPDALTGSYLAVRKNAPLLLTEDGKNGAQMQAVTDYIKKNLAEGGKIYVLGGTGAVSSLFEEDMGEEYADSIVRLEGNNRYETNLAILNEAGIDDGTPIIVSTGLNYPDCLSASALGLPLLLVPGDRLLDDQISFLSDLEGEHLIGIIGGTGVVTEDVGKTLESYASEVKRAYGSDRFETSVALAKEAYSNPSNVVFAYGQNFPDGLSAGPLAYALGAPLILTQNGGETATKPATDYVAECTTALTNAYVIGGTALISDETINGILGIEEEEEEEIDLDNLNWKGTFSLTWWSESDNGGYSNVVKTSASGLTLKVNDSDVWKLELVVSDEAAAKIAEMTTPTIRFTRPDNANIWGFGIHDSTWNYIAGANENNLAEDTVLTCAYDPDVTYFFQLRDASNPEITIEIYDAGLLQ